MGLSPAAATPGFTLVVAPAAIGIIDPSTGRPVGANDPYFLEVNHELSDNGFFVTATDDLITWGAYGIADVDDVRPCLLRRRDDADVDAALSRRRALRLRAACFPAAIRRDDRGGHADQQDGACAAQGLRPDARAALRDLDGIMRQWRRLLSLFVFGGARLRPHRTHRHLRARPPAHSGSTSVRRMLLQKKIRRTGTIER